MIFHETWQVWATFYIGGMGCPSMGHWGLGMPSTSDDDVNTSNWSCILRI
jgi:hypothetical protein